jgi:3-oxoadipate enol-lactonase
MRVHHVIEGDGPLLVLSSSLGSTTAMWEAQAAALRDRFTVVRYDHRGHGLSPVPDGPYRLEDLGRDVLGLLDELGAESAHVGGLSLGGMVAMWLGIHAPERVGRLVLCCTSARLGPPSAWAERAAAVRAGGMEAVADGVLGRWLTPAYADAHPDTVAELRAMLLSTPPDGYAACCAAIEHMDLVADLGRITAPTLVIGGAEDPATPPEHQRLIAGAIPGARLELLSPAAHMAAVERADEVTALIAEHLGAP